MLVSTSYVFGLGGYTVTNDLPKNINNNPIAVISTNKGIIELELFKKEAPLAVSNFIENTKKGFYNGTEFDKVVKGSYIQGGTEKSFWGYPFRHEIYNGKDFSKAGVIAMSSEKFNNNNGKFFITTKPLPKLNNIHTVFGKVISGFRTINRIENVILKNNKPVTKQYIKRVYIKKDSK